MFTPRLQILPPAQQRLWPGSKGLDAYFGDGDLATLRAADRATLVKAAGAVRALPEVAIVDCSLVRVRTGNA